MKKIIYEIVPLCLVWLCVSACVPTIPEWNSQFGESARKTGALQILNPDAVLHLSVSPWKGRRAGRR